MDINAYIESGVIESYVLGLATTDEAAELEILAMEHPAIKQAVEDFALSIQRNAVENGVTPPAELKQQVINVLANEFEQPKLVAMPAVESNSESAGPAMVVRMHKPNTWRYIAVASIVLLVASAGLNVYYYNGYKTAAGNYQALLDNQKTLQAYQTKYNNLQQSISILQDSAMHVIKMAGVKGKENNAATLYWDGRTKDVYVYVNNLPQAPAGKQYQLWAIVDGRPVDAGVLGNCDGVCKMKNITAAQMFAITLEKEGGSQQPTLDQMFVAGKI